jgi:hypothetical protein
MSIVRKTRRHCAGSMRVYFNVPTRATCSKCSNHCASEKLAVGMQAGNNWLQIVCIAAVWHVRCHVYLWYASVCHADYHGHQFASILRIQRITGKPRGLPHYSERLTSRSDSWTLLQILLALSVFFVHKNAVFKKMQYIQN